MNSDTHELILFAAAHFGGRKLSKRETKRGKYKVAYLLFLALILIVGTELGVALIASRRRLNWSEVFFFLVKANLLQVFILASTTEELCQSDVQTIPGS